MKNQKENTYFVNWGTFMAGDADILKKELEKSGISVKMVYPGTSIGRETLAEASFEAYTLWVRNCDLQVAEKIREKFNIKPI